MTMKAWPAALVCMTTILLVACSRPTILNNIHCDASENCSVVSQEFNRVVQEHFPTGSSEEALETELLAEGFEHPEPVGLTRCTIEKNFSAAPIGKAIIECPSWDAHWNPQNALVYRQSEGLVGACGSEAGVRWSSDTRMRLTHIEGYYGSSCI